MTLGEEIRELDVEPLQWPSALPAQQPVSVPEPAPEAIPAEVEGAHHAS
jgi:hypothetical protein